MSYISDQLLTTNLVLQSQELNKNIDNTIRLKLKKNKEGRCSDVGYIIKDSINIIHKTMGKLEVYDNISSIKYKVTYKAKIIKPSEGDIIETIKIGTLSGWDSDNPTSTWGGLIGFMIGKDGVEKAFGKQFSNRYNIHRTRIGFPNNGIDTFDHMAEVGVYIVDRVVQEQMGGGIDLKKDIWYIPNEELEISVGTE